jgi:hypothetical protein
MAQKVVTLLEQFKKVRVKMPQRERERDGNSMLIAQDPTAFPDAPVIVESTWNWCRVL